MPSSDDARKKAEREKARRYLEQEIRRLTHEVGNLQAILAGYESNPAMRQYIPGTKNRISGMKREIQDLQSKLRQI